MAVVEGFEKCQKNGSPYFLIIEHPYDCEISTKAKGLFCKLKKEQDLTKLYSSAKPETGINDTLGQHRFVADVLFTSAKGSNLLVEIEVSHACEEIKTKSGLKIIEIKIENDDDVSKLLTSIDATSDKTKTHGIYPKKEYGSCTGKCFEYAMVFVLYRSGKSWLGRKNIHNIQSTIKQPSVEYVEIVESDLEDDELQIFDYDPIVQKLTFEMGKNVKSCLVCKHHAFSSGKEGGQQPIWCYEYRQDCGHNQAAQCPKFKKISSPDEMKTKREKIAESSRNYNKPRFGSVLSHIFRT
jgi:hypothetical protein